MKVHKLMKVILSFLTILFMLGSGNNNHTLAQGNQQGGRDVTDGTKIKITNFKIFRRGTNEEVNTLTTRTGYEFQFDWDASAYGTTLKKGDYFTVKLPDAMNVDVSQTNKELDIKDEKNKVIAKAVITGADGGGGNIKFTFTEVVDNLANIKGNFRMAFVLNETKVKINEKNVLTVTVGVTNHPIVEGGILVKPAGTQNPTEELGKWVVDRVLKDFYDGTERQLITNPDAIAAIKKGSSRWLLRVNVKGANLKNVVVSDKLHGDELGYVKIIPGTFVMYEGVANEHGSATQIKNEKNISAQVNLAPDRKSFTYNLGNTEGKTYFIIYYTSFPEGSMLKVTNKAQITHEDGKSEERIARFKEAIAGGSAIGDNASRILITKVDADNTAIKLAKAKFKLYNENKQPVLGTDGQPIVLETNDGGIAQSEKLVEGTYYLEEIQAPANYLLPKDAGNNTEGQGKDNFYKVKVTKDGAQLFIPNKFGGITISGEKTWDDNDDQDGKRPKKITVILKKTVDGQTSEVKRQEVTPDSQGKWKYTFDKLVTFENGKPVEYSIDEEKVDEYDKVTTRTTNGPDYNLTNKHEPEKRAIEGQKIWNDNNNQDGKRPTSIKVKLYKKVGNGAKELKETKEVTEGADKAWKWKFENLDKYENKQEIQYTVEEEVTNGYAGVVTGSMAAGFNITNSYKPETVDISGEKTWEDNNNQDGKRPESITVKLIKQVEGGQPEVKETKVVTKGQDDKWKYEFNNLPRYENGKLITYSIDEEAVTGYKKEVTGYNLKNSYTPGKTKVQVTKAWEDKDNQDGKRPASVTVKLLADGVEVPGKTLTLTATNNWTGSFTDLDEYKAGNKIVYTVKEEEVGNGYDSKVIGSPEDGFKVINTRQTEKVNVEGTKTWNDADNQDGKRPTEIKINLLKNGTVVETKTVTEKDGWKWKFENLDKYANGEVINYTITEEAVENGYTSEITKSGENTFTVKNTREPEKTFVEGEKTWDDANNQDGKRPTSITVKLYKKVGDKEKEEVTTQEVKADKDGNWKYKFENLPKYEGGKEIKYSVKEVAVEGYTTEIKDFNITNKHVPEKTSVEGTKTWVDNNDQDGKRPGSIKVILNKTVDGKTTKVAEKEVTAKDNWNYAFNDLPKYENGKEIKYSIDEVDVPGYEKTIKGHNLENKYIPRKPKLPKTGSTPSEVGGLGVLGLLAGYVLIRRKNKAN